MSKKTVIVYSVNLAYDKEFSEVLLDENFQKKLPVDDIKTAELMYVSKNTNGTITGLFVTTQKKNIPPAHTPGEDDYSAIPLGKGQGLAYPNTILYDPLTGALFIETNKFGLNDKRISDFFNQHAKSMGIPGFSVDISFVLKSDAYERVENMFSVDSLECQVANPIQLLRDGLVSGPLEDYSRISGTMKASKTMKIILKGEEVEGGLDKNEIRFFLDAFSKIVRLPFMSKKNQLKISGRKHTDDGEMQDFVDYFLDKIKGSFELEEPNVATHLQFTERKKGITDVYTRFYKEILKILGKKN